MTTQRARGWLAGALVAAIVAAGAIPAAASEPYSIDFFRTGALGEIGASARVLAMGGASVGLADDPATLYYNPAGLGMLKKAGLVSLYTPLYGGVANYGALGFAGPSFGVGGLGLETTDVLVLDDGSQGGALDYLEAEGILGVGLGLGPIAVGASGKYYHQTLRLTPESGPSEEVRGTGITGDVGLLLALGPVRLGAVVRDAFGQIEYSYPGHAEPGLSDPLDRKVVAGAGLRLGIINAAADYELGTLGESGLDDSQGGSIRAGAELDLGIVALRAGVARNVLHEQGGSTVEEQVLSGGLGIHLGFARVDYALTQHPSLPMTHRLSLNLGF